MTKIPAIFGLFVALTVGGIWTYHNAHLTTVERTGSVVSVQRQSHLMMCGKTPCTKVDYKTAVDLGTQTVTVTRDDRARVGHNVTVFETNGHHFHGDSPTSAHELFLIAIASAVVGLLAAFAGAWISLTRIWPW